MDIKTDKRVVMDIDGVIARKHADREYANLNPDQAVLRRLRRYDEQGYYIILYTARNMNSYEGRLGKINAETAPTLLSWLETHDVPFDEIHYQKPWCGHEGFYIDDRAIRPSEFLEMEPSDIRVLLEDETRRDK